MKEPPSNIYEILQPLFAFTSKFGLTVPWARKPDSKSNTKFYQKHSGFFLLTLIYSGLFFKSLPYEIPKDFITALETIQFTVLSLIFLGVLATDHWILAHLKIEALKLTAEVDLELARLVGHKLNYSNQYLAIKFFMFLMILQIGIYSYCLIFPFVSKGTVLHHLSYIAGRIMLYYSNYIYKVQISIYCYLIMCRYRILNNFLYSMNRLRVVLSQEKLDNFANAYMVTSKCGALVTYFNGIKIILNFLFAFSDTVLTMVALMIARDGETFYFDLTVGTFSTVNFLLIVFLYERMGNHVSLFNEPN